MLNLGRLGYVVSGRSVPDPVVALLPAFKHGSVGRAPKTPSYIATLNEPETSLVVEASSYILQTQCVRRSGGASKYFVHAVHKRFFDSHTHNLGRLVCVVSGRFTPDSPKPSAYTHENTNGSGGLRGRPRKAQRFRTLTEIHKKGQRFRALDKRV